MNESELTIYTVENSFYPFKALHVDEKILPNGYEINFPRVTDTAATHYFIHRTYDVDAIYTRADGTANEDSVLSIWLVCSNLDENLIGAAD